MDGVSEALWIFRKDTRHLWPQIAAFFALMAGYTWLEASLPRLALSKWSSEVDWEALAGIVVALWSFYMIAAAIHQDALVGDRQYWLTRPYRRTSLFGAKVLFAVAFIGVPVLLSQSITLAADGFSPLAYVMGLGTAQLGVLGLLAVIAAFAAVTRNAGQCALALLSMLAVVIVMNLSLQPPAAVRDWGSVVAVAGAVGVLAFQYCSRRGALSRAILAGCVLAQGVSPGGNGPAEVPATRERAAPPAAAGLRIRFDPELGPVDQPLAWSRTVSKDAVALKIPVYIDGIPAGQGVRGLGVQARIIMGSGNSWYSGWRTDGGIAPRDGFSGKPLTVDGPAWLDLTIHRGLLVWPGPGYVHMHVWVRMGIVRNTARTSLRPGSPPRFVPGAGLCDVAVHGKSVTVPCYAPFRHAVWAQVHMQSEHNNSNTGLMWHSAPGFAIWQRASANTSMDGPFTVSVETWDDGEADYFERQFDIVSLRLARYVIGETPVK